MEAWLLDSVNSSLKLYMYRNATFLCERLHAEFPSEANLHLLATCYFRGGQAYRAYHLLKGSTKSPQCRYLFALACFEMGSMAEAEGALLNSGDPTAEVPNGAAGYYMLGLICRLTDRREAAIGHYSQALSLDPFFWSAYEDLCMLGVNENPETYFGDLAVGRLQQQSQWDIKSQYTHEDCSELQGLRSSSSPIHSKTASISAILDSPFSSSYSTPVNSQIPTTAIPPTPARNAPQPPVTPNLTTSDPNKNTCGPQQRRKFLDEGKLRKNLAARAAYSQVPFREDVGREDGVSGRLFAEPPRRSLRLSGEPLQICSTSAAAVTTPSSTTPVSSSTRISAVRVKKGLAESSPEEGSKQSEILECEPPSAIFPGLEKQGVSLRGGKSLEGAVELLDLLRTLAEAFRHLCMYRSQEALQAFSKLPQHQYETGWVLCQVGRAYFEMVDYTEAERAFRWARKVAPYRLEGSDIYSTVLYHMKKDVELSYLAQELVSMDRLSPQAWCVIGNCFSLQKDHETALKFFQRALQLDPHFTYGHTLCGHEYVAMEDFEEGLSCYRNAIRMDARHYNAWYGLGTIYFRQEKYELADYHFRKAIQINERSSVLHCYLGMALHALKKNQDALDYLGRAMRADPKNPLPKYQKANVLVSQERYQDALEVLEQLKEVAPRESSVYFLIGKVYKRLGLPDQAMYHFCIALDLKPSTADVNLIKTAIEKLYVPDELEEENL